MPEPGAGGTDMLRCLSKFETRVETLTLPSAQSLGAERATQAKLRVPGQNQYRGSPADNLPTHRKMGRFGIPIAVGIFQSGFFDLHVSP